MPPEDREDVEDTPLREQNARLRARVAELERALESAQAATSLPSQPAWKSTRLIDLPIEAIAVTDKGIVIDVSREWETLFRCSRADVIGRSALEFAAPESRELIMGKMRSGSTEPYESVSMRKDGTTFITQVHSRMIEEDGRVLRVTSLRDVTELRRGEIALRESLVREEVIKAQAAVIAELSTPLLPIAEGVLVLPLIGQVNEERGLQVLEALTRGVSAHRARVAILDITGVSAMDTHTADALLSSARAVELLGARMFLTGVSPAVAQTLVAIGANLGGIVTLATLGQGVALALEHLRFTPARHPRRDPA